MVNAEVTIAYDLKKVDYEIDEANTTLFIKRIPEPEIKINPDFEYYDVTADYLNPFEAKDYNSIKRNVNTSLMKKVKASTMVSNAQNRLLAELSQLLILTNSLGWSLVYEEQPIENLEELRLLR